MSRSESDSAMVGWGRSQEGVALAKTAEQPGYQADHDAYEQTGDDGEVKLRLPAPKMNVARQATEPRSTDSGPDDDPDQGDRQAENDDGFSQGGHALGAYLGSDARKLVSRAL